MKRPSIPAARSAYDAQQRLLVSWLRTLPADAWDRPSILDGWSVCELAFHTTEVPGALSRALRGGPVKEQPLTIADYTGAWRSNANEIAERDRSGAAGLTPHDVVARHEAEHTALSQALDGVTRDVVVAARRGPIRVSDFLVTRVNELVVHSRDLSVSVGEVPPVELDGKALGLAARMLLGIL